MFITSILYPNFSSFVKRFPSGVDFDVKTDTLLFFLYRSQWTIGRYAPRFNGFQQQDSQVNIQVFDP